MLLGLARATRGSMSLFGTTVPRGLPVVIDRIGAVVEMPKFSPTFTGRQNLELLARTRGITRDRIDAAAMSLRDISKALIRASRKEAN